MINFLQGYKLMLVKILLFLSLSVILLLTSCSSLDKELQQRKVIETPNPEKPRFPAIVLDELEMLAKRYQIKK